VPVLSFILRRVGLLVLVLVAVSMLTFAIVNVLPGDVANAVLGDMASPAQVELVRQRMGLNEPVVIRYLTWVGGILHGNLGTSLQYGQAISSMVGGRLVNSAILGLVSLLIAAPLAIAIGTIAATRPGSLLDRCISGLAVGAYAVPEYVTGLIAILLFSIWLTVLPGSSLMDPSENPLSRPEAMVLPVGVLVLGMLAFISQLTRASMIQALASPYVRTAILKGLPRRTVVLKHALPNVLPPTITEIGMYIGYVIGGQVVVETLFSYAGLGQLITNAVAFRDIPTIEVGVLIIAAAYGVGNLLADITALALNPRLRS
jgi:peptide/nickel transport system permease protein